MAANKLSDRAMAKLTGIHQPLARLRKGNPITPRTRAMIERALEGLPPLEPESLLPKSSVAHDFDNGRAAMRLASDAHLAALMRVLGDKPARTVSM
jgi:hypothetical protein